ncbi:hypothetical protein B0H17DRAFT_1140471 [Mycena rosella]|uniref:Uncharacterized protein n=1 Tax=Mycena rosella TaxID=1033263 RepID=A0AAD7GBY2_MYCRO|nr:hypothetical protein B0H17DRAFT_1140471 [Mycena rosella]
MLGWELPAMWSGSTHVVVHRCIWLQWGLPPRLAGSSGQCWWKPHIRCMEAPTMVTYLLIKIAKRKSPAVADKASPEYREHTKKQPTIPCMLIGAPGSSEWGLQAPPGSSKQGLQEPKITQKIPCRGTPREQQTGAAGAQNHPENPPQGQVKQANVGKIPDKLKRLSTGLKLF